MSQGPGVVVLVVALAAAVPANAQSLDAASAAALGAAVRLLQDPAQRAAALANSPQAAAADREIQAVLKSPELQQEFYAIAADIFTELVQTSGGDVGRMSQALEAGKSDPAGFASSLSPALLERLRALSGKIGGQPR